MSRRSRGPLLITAAVLLFFHLPVLVLVLDSFNASRFAGWGGWSLVWYRRLFQQPAIWDALSNTLVVAAGATVVSTILGTAAAFALHRWKSRLQKTHHALIVTPLVVPEILMGISLLLFFVALKIELGLLTIFLAHTTFCLSYVAMVVLARLQDFDFTLVEAARDLGASGWTVLRRVLLPLLAPGIAAGALLAFTLSIDDFVITSFVAGKGSTTLPVLVYSLIKHGATPLINALSTLLLAATAALVWTAQRLLGDSFELE
jgi:spermidine/putrescine transport system permease protein